ncbi:COMM domain-containing protein 4 [Lycorma delicatula]|uniref:COMM domain-containing protein 4 n=1 Tax=Lycorma delicatula TaxID=130591 RepID=UPI003F517835
MRFRFCGDGDCPDWVLLQINTLARMSSVKIKIFCQVVAKTIGIGEELDFTKVKKLTADAKLDLEDMKASIMALVFILESSARYGVSESALSNELQQIGLPREHSQAICKVYCEHSSAITERLAQSSLRISSLSEAAARPNGSYFDVQLTSWQAETGHHHIHCFTLSRQQMELLIQELKTANARMLKLQGDL